MPEDEKNDSDDEAIHRVDTVPPPDGESDAYNSPTKVGPGAMAESVMNEMMVAASAKAAELREKAAAKAIAAKSKSAQAAPVSATKSAPPRKAVEPEPEALGTDDLIEEEAGPVQLYAEEDEDGAATLLHPMAPRPNVPPQHAAVPSVQHTARLPVAVTRGVVEVVAQREQQARSYAPARHVGSPQTPALQTPRFLLLPLFISLTILVIGVLMYSFMR